jgi:hypothetical protein
MIGEVLAQGFIQYWSTFAEVSIRVGSLDLIPLEAS